MSLRGGVCTRDTRILVIIPVPILGHPGVSYPARGVKFLGWVSTSYSMDENPSRPQWRRVRGQNGEGGRGEGRVCYFLRTPSADVLRYADREVVSTD